MVLRKNTLKGGRLNHPNELLICKFAHERLGRGSV